MLPPMCTIEACMNMPVKIVSQDGSRFSAGMWFAFSRWVLQTIRAAFGLVTGATSAQWTPGWRIANGIAPYLKVS